MFKKGLAVLMMALMAAPLLADIELVTSISDVFYRGDSELAGSVTMRVNADDFADTSTANPVFLRVTLDRQATLASTLVNQASTGFIGEPIYLAMTLNTNSSAQSIVADPATASIVRWVAGEAALWIRVQTSSSNWIFEGNADFDADLDVDADDFLPGTVGVGNQSPEEELTVSWTFGVSARSSWERTRNIPIARKNLPFNTRNTTIRRDLNPDVVSDDADYAVSTLLCVDLSGSNLTNDGTEDSILRYDAISFDRTADLNNGQYGVGNQAGINFTNDFRIARGKDRACTVEVADKGAFVTRDICLDDRSGNSTPPALDSFTNTISFIINCSRGGDFLSTDLHPGSTFTFTIADGPTGFSSALGTNTLTLGTNVFDTSFSGAFSEEGNTLYKSVTFIYRGASVSAVNRSAGVSLSVFHNRDNGATDVNIDWTILLASHDGQADTAPFDGNGVDGSGNPNFLDQDRRCAPSTIVPAGNTGTWAWGTWEECLGEDAVLFFPYLPRLQNNESLFWAGLSVVNQGGVDLSTMTVHIYDENGNLWVADLPSLASRNQYTWLLSQNDDGQVGFTGFGGNNEGDFRAPAPNDPDVDPASYGTTRSSMYIVGGFETDLRSARGAGDLDGYLLVGRDFDIDGSYLPRKDIRAMSVNGRDGSDIPVNRSKNN